MSEETSTLDGAVQDSSKITAEHPASSQPTESIQKDQSQALDVPLFDLINKDGSLAENWHKSKAIPEPIRGSKILEKYKTLEGLMSGTHNAGKMVGMDKEGFAVIPNENSDPEDVNKFWSQLGKPESPEGYEFAPPEGVNPEEWNSDLDKWFATKAYEYDLPKSQASQIREAFNSELMPMLQEQVEAQDQAKVDAREMSIVKDPELGGANLKETVQAGNQAIGHIFEKYGIEKDSQQAKEFLGMVDKNEILYREIVEIGKSMQEGEIRGFDSHASQPSESIDAQIKSAYAELNALGPAGKVTNQEEYSKLQNKIYSLQEKKFSK